MKEKNNERITGFGFVGLAGFVGIAVPLFLLCVSIFSVSCKMTAEGIVSASDDVRNPVLSHFSQESEGSVLLAFTEEVELSSLEVREEGAASQGEPVFSGGQIGLERVQDAPPFQNEEKGVMVRGVFPESQTLDPGVPYILSGVALDGNGNSLLFQVPFHGFNNRVAGVVLSEVRTEAEKMKTDKAKLEYVELYVHTAGNLAGISLWNANDDKKYGEYVFPAAEVKAGDYVVVHFRTMDEHASGCIDETGDDLNASTAPDSCADVRDFWVPGTGSRLGKSDVILLRERSGGSLMDALLYVQSSAKDSTRSKLVETTRQFLGAEAGQEGIDFSTWVSGDGLTTINRTLSRQNIGANVAGAGDVHSASAGEHWFVTKTVGKDKGATPGAPNSSNRYEAN